MTGRIHSIQSLGTVDGPGVRSVIFTAGCPLRCVFCHNPDTWDLTAGTECDHEELVKKILRFYPYIKNGGVTFSGGEPCLQADFLCAVAAGLKAHGLHIALDTSGAVESPAVDKLLELVDLVMLDIKFTEENAYKLNTGTTLSTVLHFLDKLDRLGKDTWIRHVVIPGLTDSEEGIIALARLIKPYKCVKKTELLPFKKLCLEKYEALGSPFPLRDTPEMPDAKISALYDILSRELSGE